MSKKKISNIMDMLEIHVEKIETLESIVEDLVEKYQPITGAMSMTVDRDNMETYYMVTDLRERGNFIEFYHLLAEDNRPLSLESFGDRGKKTLYQHAQAAYKSDRWVIVKEQILVGSFAGLKFIGSFTYHKLMKRGDYPYKFNVNNTSVTPMKKA